MTQFSYIIQPECTQPEHPAWFGQEKGEKVSPMVVGIIFVATCFLTLITMRLGRIADMLRASNALAEREGQKPQRFVETFIVDSDYLEDESFEEALDQEIWRRLGKNIQIHKVQDTFFKKDLSGFDFHGAVRTVIYSKL